MEQLIKKYLREASETGHYKERLDTRFYNRKPYQTTNVPNILTPISYEKAKHYLEILKRVDFPKNLEFAVAIGYSPIQDKFNPKGFNKASGFYYYDKNKREEDSWGHIIWVVVKNNKLITITLHREELKDKDNNYKPYQKISIEKLITYINKVKKPKSADERIDLTSKEEFDFMKSADFKPLNKNEIELPINDKVYVVDKKGRIFYPQYQPKLSQDIESYVLAVDKLVDESKAKDEEVNLALELIGFIS